MAGAGEYVNNFKIYPQALQTVLANNNCKYSFTFQHRKGQNLYFYLHLVDLLSVLRA